MKGIKILKKKRDMGKSRFKTTLKKLYRINARPRKSRIWFRPKLHLPFTMCSVH